MNDDDDADHLLGAAITGHLVSSTICWFSRSSSERADRYWSLCFKCHTIQASIYSNFIWISQFRDLGFWYFCFSNFCPFLGQPSSSPPSFYFVSLLIIAPQRCLSIHIYLLIIWKRPFLQHVFLIYPHGHFLSNHPVVSGKLLRMGNGPRNFLVKSIRSRNFVIAHTSPPSCAHWCYCKRWMNFHHHG